MSKTIQEALDLPVLEDLLKSSKDEQAEDEPEVTEEMAEDYEATTSLADNLAKGGVTQDVIEDRRERDHETKMESLFKEALQHSKDLMDLGYNVDSRSARGMFEQAANFMKIAMDASNSKRDAQLKTLNHKLNERKVDIVEKGSKGGKGGGDTIESESVVVQDRNELIKQLREQQDKDREAQDSKK